MSEPLELNKGRVFRETPGVLFADINVDGQNGLDIVRHDMFAVSPPNVGEDKQFYSHNHQTDNNRTIYGARVFELVACEGQLEHKHYLVYLSEGAGALRIPPRVYHRSVSCSSGSILLNHAIRDELYDENTEFFPRRVSETPELKKVLDEDSPVCINASREDIECFLKTGSIDECILHTGEKPDLEYIRQVNLDTFGDS